MSHLFLTAGLAACLALQPLLNERLAEAPFAVQLPLLLAAVAMFITEGALTLVWAAAAGLVSDSFSPAPAGIDMLAVTLTVFTVRAVLGAKPSFHVPMLLVGASVVVFSSFLLSATARAVWHHVPADVAVLLEHSLRATVGTVGLLFAGWLAVKGARRWNPLRLAVRGTA